MTLENSLALKGPKKGFAPNLWDVAAFGIVLGAFALAAHGARQTLQPLEEAQQAALSLDPRMLPEYALRTTLRMFAAMAASLAFTFTYATLAAKSRRAEMLLIPALDVLQSVPVLGFISFTVAGFMGLFPGRALGAELASVFAIFTSQAWNMAFSFHQSLRTVPKDLAEAARVLRLSAWQRFWRLEAPFAMPGLIWNAMMSMSGGWFFVVASEAIAVGDTTLRLPGIGSYVALAIERRDLASVGWAVLAMLVVIVICDQLIFRPLVAWGDKFRCELSASQAAPGSWFLDLVRRTRLFRTLLSPLGWAADKAVNFRLPAPRALRPPRAARPAGAWGERIWRAACVLAGLSGIALAVRFLSQGPGLSEIPGVLALGLATLARVLVLIALASLVWVPVGVFIGRRPRLSAAVQPVAQFLAAFPANLLFPAAVVVIVRFDLAPDVWLSPLMILGTQWYILFNVIAGASALPGDLMDAASNLRVGGLLRWRRVILPGIFPYYITGAVTASGGSWNASIVAEVVQWGGTTLTAHGLGAYIATATAEGDFHRIVLGIAVMSFFVISLNRLLWRPLYAYAANRFTLD